MADRNICNVDILETMTEDTNVIVEENGALNKFNIYNEFNTVNTKINNEIDAVNTKLLQLSNPNLLINSDFRNPVNQRAQTSYSGASTSTTYTIDRWYIGKYDTTATLYVRDGYIEWTNSDTTYARYLSQLLERVLPNDYYTLSVNVKSLNGSCEVGLIDENNNGLGVLTLKNGFNHLTINGKIKRVQFKLMQNSSIQLEYGKLEQGSIATPLVPRPYAEELALCQRYFQFFIKQPIYAASTNNTSYFGMHYNIPMRTNPTMRLLNVYNSSATEITDVTLSSQISYASNMVYITLSKTVTQYGYITYILDGEIY